MINKKDFIFLQKTLNENNFRYAKSMPEFPHWYTLRKDWSKDDEFIETVLLIRKYGKIERYWGKEYIYFYMNGYKYWTMGAPLEKTILINRAKL